MSEDSSLRDTIAAAYDSSIESSDSPSSAAEPQSAPTSEPSADSSSAETSAEVEEVAAEAAADKATEEVATDLKDAKVTPDTEAEEPIKYPASWSAEDKTKVSKLPRDLQEFLVKRESQRDRDYQRKTKEIAQTQQTLKEFERIIAPRAHIFEKTGLPPVQVVQKLFEAHENIERDPVNAIRNLMRNNGVTLEHLTNQGSSVSSDPALHSVTRQVEELRQTLQQQRQASQQQYLQALQNEVEQFSQETDEQGNPLRPELEMVEDDMVDLIPIVKKNNPTLNHREVLNEAYSRALRFNPQAFEAWQKRQAAEDAKRRLEEAKQKVSAAKKASVSVSGAPGAGVNSATPHDLRSVIEQAWSEHSH